MNLSSRLDAARRQREQGKAKELDRHPLDLRYVAEEGQTYDGHELRTGEELTPEKWDELRRREEEAGLPAWRPDPPPGESFADSASLIDLTQVGPAEPLEPPPPGPEIALPAWAHQEVVDAPTPPPSDEGGTAACVNCGGEPRVDVLDMLSGMAHLECTGCGFKWQAPTKHRRWPGRA